MSTPGTQKAARAGIFTEVNNADGGHLVYVSSNHYGDQCGPVLRCTNHPGWEADVDGLRVEDAVKAAQDHVSSAGLYPTTDTP